MAKIVQTTDFVGKYKVTANSFTTTHLQSFIDKYEKKYLYDLLGVELGDLFYADIVTPFTAPTTLIYSTIFNTLSLDYNCTQVRSDGIKEMLVGFIYWEFVRTQSVVNTPLGGVMPSNEVSTIPDWNSTQIYQVYNEAVKNYRSIQIYINNNMTLYPLYNGLMKSYNSWAI